MRGTGGGDRYGRRLAGEVGRSPWSMPGQPGPASSSLLFDRARDDGQILLAKPLVHGLLLFVGQASEDGEPAVTGRLQSQVDVLERERQRELGGELAAGDPLQLGRLPR